MTLTKKQLATLHKLQAELCPGSVVGPTYWAISAVIGLQLYRSEEIAIQSLEFALEAARKRLAARKAEEVA